MLRLSRSASVLCFTLSALFAFVLPAPRAQVPAAQTSAQAVGTPPDARWSPSILRKQAERWYASGRKSPDQYSVAWHLFQSESQHEEINLARQVGQRCTTIIELFGLGTER